MNQIAILPPDQVQLPAYALAPATAAQIALRGTLDETGGVSVRRITPDNGRFNFMVGDAPMADPGPLNVVVVAFAPRMGRTYYDGPYIKGESSRPDCWSADGITPDSDVPPVTKQSQTCATCAKSMKGSKVVDGREMAACSLSQKIIVTPPNKVGDPDHIYLMQINATSVLSQNVPTPYMSYRDYLSWFRQRNASGANVLPQHALTEISFVVRADAPNHMQFRIANWAPEALARKVEEFASHPTVQMYLHGPNGPKNSAIPLAAQVPVAAPVAPTPVAPIYAAPVPNAFAQPATQAAPAGFGAFSQPATAPTVPVAAPAPAPVVQPAATNAPPPGRRGRGRPAVDPAAAPQVAPATQGAFGGSGFGATAAQPTAPAQGGFGVAAAPTSAFSAAAGFGGFADAP